MTAAVQASLPNMPAIPGKVDDLEEWFTIIWPVFVAAADTGLPWTVSEIAAAAKLPDPPKSQFQWGLVPRRLRAAGVVKAYSETGNSTRPGVHGSLVHQWVGIPADERAEAAA